MLALIGDGRTAAIVRDDGGIDWLCWPRFDSPSIFAARLDAHAGGRFVIRTSDATSTRQQYVEDTNVLVTTFESPSGVLELTDAMVDGEAPCVLRSARCTAGRVDVEVIFDPRFDFGATATALEATPGGGVRARAGVFALTLDSAVEFDVDEQHAGARARFGLRADEQRSFWMHSIVPTEAALEGAALDRRAEQVLRATANGWRTWTNGIRYHGKYEAPVRRSALLLKLLQHRHGGFVAAPTVGLDDARFVWPRHASNAARALAMIGHDGALKAYLGFVDAGLKHAPDNVGVSTLDARVAPDSRSIDHLSPEVFVGHSSSQDDVGVGHVLDAVALSVRCGHGLMTEAWERYAAMLERPRAATQLALRRAAFIAQARGDVRADDWRRRAKAATEPESSKPPASIQVHFEAAEHHATNGEIDRALERFGVGLLDSNAVGLLAERSGQGAAGHFPWAGSHAALIFAALAIDRACQPVKTAP